MYKLITHNDLDGIGAVILARLAFGDDVDVSIVHSPAEATEVLTKLHNDNIAKTFSSIFVTDCSFDESIVPMFKNIKLFDHHKTAIELNKYDWACVQVELNNRSTCGTELFHRYLVNKGLITERPYFIELVRLYDTWDWAKQVSKMPKYLNSLIYIIGMNAFIKSFVNKLAYNDINELSIFSEDERLLILNNDTSIAKYIERKLRYVKKLQAGKFTIGVSFADSNQSELGNAICTQLECDIALMFNMDSGLLSMRTTNDNIDVSKIAQLFNGGGHAKASGGMIDASATDNFIEQILDKVVKYSEQTSKESETASEEEGIKTND